MLKRGAWIVLLILLINLATALEGDFNNDGCVKFDDYLDFLVFEAINRKDFSEH